MSLKFGQIILLVSMATYGIIMKKTVLPLFLGFCLSDPFHTCSNDDMNESWKEFKIQPDLTTECGVSCPLASEKIPIGFKWKNGVVTFSQLFLIKFVSYLEVTMTYIELGRVRNSATSELLNKITKKPLEPGS